MENQSEELQMENQRGEPQMENHNGELQIRWRTRVRNQRNDANKKETIWNWRVGN